MYIAKAYAYPGSIAYKYTEPLIMRLKYIACKQYIASTPSTA
jgi:hypothetical protein